MSKEILLDLLEHYHPYDIQEQYYKKNMINFIKSYEACFERTLLIGHITASAWLLNKDYSKALLMHHAKLNRWVQPGGHCDGEPDVLKVAIKEAQEESGIQAILPLSHNIFDIDIHLIPANIKEPEHYHYDVRFLLAVVNEQEVHKNHEAHALKWVSKDSTNITDWGESIFRMFNKWIMGGF